MGGHIYVNVASKLRVYNSIFENAETDSMGGSFAVTESLFLLHGAVIRNTRSGLGGAIQCFSKSKCMIYDTIVNNSEASDSGGVIYLFDSTLVIENSHFSDFIGSAVDSSKSNSINITQTIFENGKNSAGAAVNCIACVDVRIKNSKFQDLSANYGGALAFDYATVSKSLYTVIIENSIFDSCRSLYGGAIYSKNMNIDILNSRFQDNNATDGGVCLQGEGGAIYMTSDNSVDISISDSSFFNNLACMSGGGIQ